MVRPTSTSQNPTDDTKVPLPDKIRRKQVLKKAKAEAKEMNHAIWAAVSKVLACDLKDYDSGKGRVEVWKRSKEMPKDRADLSNSGNSMGLALKLGLVGSSSEDLMSAKLPDKEYRVALRLFDTDRRLEVMTKFRSTGSFKERSWAFYFTSDKDNMRQSKSVLRRLLLIAREMPEN